MAESPIIETPLGKVQGRKCVKPKDASGKQVYRYAKIPFAKPPLGDLRFEAPVKSGPWDGVINAPKQCPQPMQPVSMMEALEGFMAIPNEFDEDYTEFDEDCLYLNVWTSNSDNSNAKKPVLFWIYGGGFQIGGSKTYDGSVLASMNDVVVVIPNYRVSAFGFLSLSGTSCTGNMGLLDQAMALEWVRDNIASFGGDPDNVTIFGESAGGISVSLQVHSSVSQPLFHKAISHSGVCNFPMLMKDDNDVAVKKLMELLNIKDEDHKVCLEKLKKVPAKEIIDIADKAVKQFVYFCPVKHDGKFFTEHLDSIIKNKKFSKIPYIIGANSTEGNGLLATSWDEMKGFHKGLSEEDGKECIKMQMMFTTPPDKVDAVVEAILKEYAREKKDTDVMYYSRILGEVSGDTTFVVNSIGAADNHSNTKSPTYFYHMTQSVRYNHDPEYNLSENKKLKTDIVECDHGDDLNFTFGVPLSNAKLFLEVKYTDEETQFSRVWMKYLANFAHTGNPNDGPNKMEVEWPRYDTTTKKYLETSYKCKVKENLSASRVKFWNETYPAIIGK